MTKQITATKTIYRIFWDKKRPHLELFEGTIGAAVTRAKELDAEYQPDMGVQVENTEGTCLYNTDIDG